MEMSIINICVTQLGERQLGRGSRWDRKLGGSLTREPQVTQFMWLILSNSHEMWPLFPLFRLKEVHSLV